MRTLNLGILAHVDAGKTSLTERLLFDAGVIADLGSVDDGSTQTDTMALERQRGITIRSAVASFVLDHEVAVNLLDTPGHPDFIAEVERVLSVLDGAVLVVSAVEGVQPQTRVLMRALRRLRIPTLIFVNKIDRRGARPGALVGEIATTLDLRVAALGTTVDAGTPGATFRPDDLTDPAILTRLAEVLAEDDDQLLAAFVTDDLSGRRVRAALRRQTTDAQVHPLVTGSAITGAGVDALRDALVRWLPSIPADPADDAPAVAQVFTVDRGPRGDKIAFVRVRRGVLRVRDRVWVGDREQNTVTGVSVVVGGGTERAEEVGPGRIAILHGLSAVRVGDTVGHAPQPGSALRAFAPPTLETVVLARDPADRGRLHAALTELAEQDPLINVHLRGEELSVALYGEVQKEVIEAILLLDHDVAVDFTDTTTLCIERVTGTGSAVETIGGVDNPYLAGIGLRVEPRPVGSGVTYAVDGFVLGTLPPAFFTAVEETVPGALEIGRHGWSVTDCAVTLTDTGYYPRQSHAHATFDKAMSSVAGDFRALTPLVLATALDRAGTVVCEPVQRFTLELPAEALSPVLALVAALAGVPDQPEPRGTDWVLTGEIPAAAVHTLTQRLPSLTSGEGVLEHEFARYRPVVGSVPERTPTGPDPRQRRTYLLQVRR